MVLEQLTPRQFARFRDLIYAESGICIDERKVALLTNRIRRRLRAGNFTDFDVYFAWLRSPRGVAELSQFLDAITTNETFFFRTPEHFDWFKHEFVPELIRAARLQQRPQSIRIWSAGCASGAEPYTIALCLAEQRYRLRDWTIRILGTDLSERALEAGRAGNYKAHLVEGVPEKLRKRYFQWHPETTTWTVQPELRGMVELTRHNLLKPLHETAFDCVFIRNVLIYFDHASKQRAIEHLIAAMAVGGYLVVGPSEGIYDLLAPLQKRAAFLYQKVTPSRG